MIIYKLSHTSVEEDSDFIIKRQHDWENGDEQDFIPMSENNKDYQEYLKWVAEGNTPEPADE